MTTWQCILWRLRKTAETNCVAVISLRLSSGCIAIEPRHYVVTMNFSCNQLLVFPINHLLFQKFQKFVESEIRVAPKFLLKLGKGPTRLVFANSENFAILELVPLGSVPTPNVDAAQTFFGLGIFTRPVLVPKVL